MNSISEREGGRHYRDGAKQGGTKQGEDHQQDPERGERHKQQGV